MADAWASIHSTAHQVLQMTLARAVKKQLACCFGKDAEAACCGTFTAWKGFQGADIYLQPVTYRMEQLRSMDRCKQQRY